MRYNKRADVCNAFVVDGLFHWDALVVELSSRMLISLQCAHPHRVLLFRDNLALERFPTRRQWCNKGKTRTYVDSVSGCKLQSRMLDSISSVQKIIQWAPTAQPGNCSPRRIRPNVRLAHRIQMEHYILGGIRNWKSLVMCSVHNRGHLFPLLFVRFGNILWGEVLFYCKTMGHWATIVEIEKVLWTFHISLCFGAYVAQVDYWL